MRKFLLPIIVLLLFFSCGKKKEIIASGRIEEGGSDYSTWEEFIDKDSAFVVYRDGSSGIIYMRKKAKSLAELRDSTYSSEFYYTPSGKLLSIDYFRDKKHIGESLSFYESGKKKSSAFFLNGVRGNYETWYENGNLMVKGELLPDGTFRHREYYENGSPKKEMISDKNGKGSCTYYFMNGKIRENGALMDFEPSGIWKIYDSLGNPRQDTLFGLKMIEIAE